MEATAPGGPPITRSAAAAPLQAEAARVQSYAAAAVPMFNEEGMRWNSTVQLTRREALESLRARLSNPGLRDADPSR